MARSMRLACGRAAAAVGLALAVSACLLAGGARAADLGEQAGLAAAAAPMAEQVAKLAREAVQQVANGVGTYHTLPEPFLWEDALKYCEEKTPNGRLCSLADYCPDGAGNKPVGGTQIGASWAPVNDYHNEWVSIGNDAKALCRSHTEVNGETPAWGVTANPKGVKMPFKGKVMCCENVMTYTDNKAPTWEETNLFCSTAGKRLCRRDEYCPKGPGFAPSGGTMYNAVWAAVYDDVNEWVATGFSFPRNLLCKTHTEIAKTKPRWGPVPKFPNAPRHMMTMCCDDAFDNIAGKITYRNAAAYCTEKKRRLCTRDEMCPDGPGKPPRGGLRPGEAWAPVSDSENEWVSVGTNDDKWLCKLHTESMQVKPDWGTTTGWRGHIMCCDLNGKGPQESSEQSEESTESTEPAKAAEPPKKPEDTIKLADVDLKLAEQTVKAREAEQTAKAIARDQAAKRREEAVTAEKDKEVVKAVTDEQQAKRKTEETMKHADGLKEAAKKRAEQILSEARSKAQMHTTHVGEKNDASLVWVNLPKQAELMGPGERVNSLNRQDE